MLNLRKRKMLLPHMCYAKFRHSSLYRLGIGYVLEIKQEAQLMLTTGSTRLAVSRGQQTWYHSTCNI